MFVRALCLVHHRTVSMLGRYCFALSPRQRKRASIPRLARTRTACAPPPANSTARLVQLTRSQTARILRGQRRTSSKSEQSPTSDRLSLFMKRDAQTRGRRLFGPPTNVHLPAHTLPRPPRHGLLSATRAAAVRPRSARHVSDGAPHLRRQRAGARRQHEPRAHGLPGPGLHGGLHHGLSGHH